MKKSILAALFVWFLLLFVQNNVFAQQENAVSEQTQSFNISTDPSQIQLNVNTSNPAREYKEPSTFWLLCKMIFALAVVAGIAYLVFYLLKKNMKESNDNDPFLRKVSQINLGTGKSVQIVTLQGNAYLLGVTDNNINLIGKVEDKELVNAMNLYADKNENVTKPRSFAEILDIFMPGSSKEGSETIYNQNENSDFLKNQAQRLNTEENNQ